MKDEGYFLTKPDGDGTSIRGEPVTDFVVVAFSTRDSLLRVFTGCAT
jgi:hypothetical protein